MSRYASGKYNLKNPEKYIGKSVPTYRSGWEFTFMKFCDEHPNVEQWASESVRIPYRNPLSGKQTIYVPDFLVSYVDKNSKKHVELMEVKPKNQSLKENLGKSKHNQAAWLVNQAKWEAAKAWCKQRGIFFRVVTEDDIFASTKGNSRR